jgi:hypothetical protein
MTRTPPGAIRAAFLFGAEEPIKSEELAYPVSLNTVIPRSVRSSDPGDLSHPADR